MKTVQGVIDGLRRSNRSVTVSVPMEYRLREAVKLFGLTRLSDGVPVDVYGVAWDGGGGCCQWLVTVAPGQVGDGRETPTRGAATLDPHGNFSLPWLLKRYTPDYVAGRYRNPKVNANGTRLARDARDDR